MDTQLIWMWAAWACLTLAVVGIWAWAHKAVRDLVAIIERNRSEARSIHLDDTAISRKFELSVDKRLLVLESDAAVKLERITQLERKTEQPLPKAEVLSRRWSGTRDELEGRAPSKEKKAKK